jgi:hypothetical protein
MSRFTTLEELMDYVTISGGAVTVPALTVSGATTFSGGTAGTTRKTASSAAAGATVALTAADSGKVLINASSSGSPSWTLPTAADGLYFTFVCADATAGFTVTGGTIKAKTSAAGTAISGTTLTNTQGTAVVGDTITLVCNGTNWYMTAQSGIFAAS